VTQPLVVVTNWGAHGALLLGLLMLSIAAAGVAYWWALKRAERFSLWAVVAIAALGIAAAWCAPVLFSSDVYAYAAYGELARIGLDPYSHVAQTGNDALLRDAAWQWGGSFPACVYGPAFVALAQLVIVALAPFGTPAQLEGMRAIASAAFLFCIPLAYAAFSGDARVRLRAAATIGLNPVAIWCAAEGHNDAIALAFALAGFALVRRRRAGIGAAIVALSALIKLPPAAGAIALAVYDRRARIGAVVGLVAAAALSFPLVRAIATQLAPHGQYAPQASLQAVLAPLGTAPALALALAVGAALALHGITLLGRNRNEGWVCLALAGWVLVPNPYPWYTLWLIAVAAIAPRTRAGAVAILLSFTSLLRYVPDAVGTPSAPLSVALGALATLPLLGLL
jgi:alpha-1,6-mannosyltransferase